MIRRGEINIRHTDIGKSGSLAKKKKEGLWWKEVNILCERHGKTGICITLGLTWGWNLLPCKSMSICNLHMELSNHSEARYTSALFNNTLLIKDHDGLREKIKDFIVPRVCLIEFNLYPVHV